MSDVGLDRLNRMPLPDALRALGACCGSSSWCFRMASGLPYPSRSELMRFAELKFRSLTKNEWMEAFAHHTPVGEKLANNKAFSAEEKENLEDSCRQYLRRFGHVFIIQTAGMKPKEILSQLRRRLKYDAYDELYVAGQHQSRITKGKLVTLLTELSRVDEVRQSEGDPIAEKLSSGYLKARGRQIASSADLAKKSA